MDMDKKLCGKKPAAQATVKWKKSPEKSKRNRNWGGGVIYQKIFSIF